MKKKVLTAFILLLLAGSLIADGTSSMVEGSLNGESSTKEARSQIVWDLPDISYCTIEIEGPDTSWWLPSSSANWGEYSNGYLNLTDRSGNLNFARGYLSLKCDLTKPPETNVTVFVKAADVMRTAEGGGIIDWAIYADQNFSNNISGYNSSAGYDFGKFPYDFSEGGFQEIYFKTVDRTEMTLVPGDSVRYTSYMEVKCEIV